MSYKSSVKKASCARKSLVISLHNHDNIIYNIIVYNYLKNIDMGLCYFVLMSLPATSYFLIAGQFTIMFIVP